MSCGTAGGYEVLSHEAYADKIGRRTLRDEVSTCAVEPCAVEPCAVEPCACDGVSAIQHVEEPGPTDLVRRRTSATNRGVFLSSDSCLYDTQRRNASENVSRRTLPDSEPSPPTETESFLQLPDDEPPLRTRPAFLSASSSRTAAASFLGRWSFERL